MPSGIAVTEENGMHLAGGDRPMPAKEAKDLSVSVGQEGRNVEEAPRRLGTVRPRIGRTQA